MVVRASAAVLGQMNTDAVPTRATTTDPPSVMYARRDNARPARRSARANATAISARRMAKAQQTRNGDRIAPTTRQGCLQRTGRKKSP